MRMLERLIGGCKKPQEVKPDMIIVLPDLATDLSELSTDVAYLGETNKRLDIRENYSSRPETAKLLAGNNVVVGTLDGRYALLLFKSDEDAHRYMDKMPDRCVATSFYIPREDEVFMY